MTSSPSYRGHDYPVDLSFLSSSAEQSAILESYLRSCEDPGEKINYSDWSNFNTFSSCYNRYNIFLWRLFNEYDRTWSWDEYLNWWDKLNGYEKYAFKQYPSYTGHFYNSGSNSYVVGVDYENKMSLTSSDNALSIEFCCQLTSSYAPGFPDQYMVKRGRNIDQAYYEVFLSASDHVLCSLSSSEMIFRVQSGSVVFSASCPFSSSYYNVGHHFAFCYSSAGAETRAYVDGTLALVTSSSPIGSLVLQTGSSGYSPSVYIGTRCPEPPPGPAIGEYLEGSVDELRIWNSYRTADQIAEYYNRHIHWEPELILYAKFNEPHYITADGSPYNVVYDYAKKPIDLRIQNYSIVNKVSGSLVMADGYDHYDPIILEDYPDVITHINEVWASAKEFDATNRYLITNLIPQSYIDEEEIAKSYNLTNLLYVFARQLDEMKVHIQEIGNFNNAEFVPYKLLQTAIKLYGFESFDNFPMATIGDYLTRHSASNDIIYSVREVNDIFWRNLLSNISYIYKTKGTKESINSFLHCVGLNEEIVSIKDYDSTYSYPITSSYVNKTRYSKVLNFGGRPDNEDIEGTNIYSTASYFAISASQLSYTAQPIYINIEQLISFKPYMYYESGTFYEKIVTSQPNIETGSLWGIKSNIVGGYSEYCLLFVRDITSSFGQIVLRTSSSIDGDIYNLTTPMLDIFNGDYYNVVWRMDLSPIIPTHNVDIRKLGSDGEPELIYSGSTAFEPTFNDPAIYIGAFTGSSVSTYRNTETTQTEVRLCSYPLLDEDLDAHCKNYTSVGMRDPESQYVSLFCHWILDDGIQSTAAGTIDGITNYSSYKSSLDVTGSLFAPSTTGNFYYHLFEYNHLCPDVSLKYNTNEIIYGDHDKINTDFDRVDMLSVEYNAIDALNEDQTRLFSNMNKMSNLIGVPILAHHNNYGLKGINDAYFTRLSGSVSFVNYFNNIAGVDKFYMRIIEKLIPARSYFIGEEKIIESHMLERNKEVTNLSKETTVYRDLGASLMSRPVMRTMGSR